MQNIAQHLLFARGTKNYLIFLDVLYITNAFYFHEVEKIVNHLPCKKLFKRRTRKFVCSYEFEKNKVTLF